jgi:RNA polymerase sigma-70 factor (ECF subfamily)
MKQLKAMVEKLSQKYRILIELICFDEFSYEEITTKMDLPIGTVKAQLSRAKDMLYKLYNPSKDNF